MRGWLLRRFWLVWLVVALASGLSSPCLYARPSPDSPTTTTTFTVPSLTPLLLLMQADTILTVLDAQAQKQQQLVTEQALDLNWLSERLRLSEASLETLGQRLEDCLLALDTSQKAQVQLSLSLNTLTISFDAQSRALQKVNEAATMLAADASKALIAERAKLLPWQIAGVGGGVVGFAAVVYFVGHLFGAW